MKIKLQNVRLSFPSLFRKAVFNGEETKFEATLLIAKDSPLVADIKKAIDAKLQSDFEGKKLPADKICFKDGDDFDYDGYAGNYSIKASNNKRPIVIDKDKTPLTEDDNRIYAGCYVNVIVELWAQNNSYGKRINANLLGVQFAKDGEPFGDGGVSASADDFDMVEGDDEDMFA
jgi:hypothetical protein